MTDHIAALEVALQAGPTDGPWYASGHFGEWAIASDHSVEGKLHAGAGRQFVACCFRASKKDAPKYARMFEATARYIAAANPAAIRALLAELQRLRAENEAQRTALHKIHEIRNDIIRQQKLGWSAHVYPLVAALGQVGLTYEEAAIEADIRAQAAKERT